MSFYLDASVLVALQLPEPRSAAADAFTLRAEAPLLISEFGAGELSSAIMRLVRMNQLTRDQADTLFLTFDEWRAGSTTSATIDEGDFRLAQQLVRNPELGLRMPDALHLAICVRRRCTLVTFDESMARAARTIDLDVEMPA